MRPVKLIDKYMFRMLLTPLAYCFAAFTMIYVIYDLFDNLPDFVEGRTSFVNVVQFYVFLLPSVLTIIAPVSLMLSVLYSLSQLTKNNELTALRASGISLYRLMVPILVVGLLFSVAVGIVNETVGPWSSYWTHQFVSLQRHKGDMSAHVAANLAFKDEMHRRVLMIGEFDTQSFDLRRVDLTQQRPDGSDEFRILAQEARWLDGRWWFMDLVTTRYDRDGSPVGPPRFELRREMADLAEEPKDFVNEIKDPEFLSAVEILHFLRTHRSLSKDAVSRIRVDLHHRLAMPWTCLIVTMLGIPFGAQTGRKGALRGVVLALGLFFGYYFLVNVGLALGKKQSFDPWLAGWIPNLFFLGTGMVLLYRMR